MDFSEILIAIVWGPLFGLLASQSIVMFICLTIWITHFKKLNYWPAMEYFLLSLGPAIKAAASIAIIFIGNIIVSDGLDSRRIYEYLFMQSLVFVGLMVGAIYGVTVVRQFKRHFLSFSDR